MAITWTRQETQIRNSDLYNDAIAPTEAAFETNPTNIEDDLNNMRSQMHNLMKVQGGNWWDDLAVPATFTGEGEAKRGVDGLNSDLHELERKRLLTDVFVHVDVTVGGTDDYVILGTGELPLNTTAAVGAVTTLGTVVAAHGGTFGTHSLAEVSGASNVTPKNLCLIVDSVNHDPILSGGRIIYALLQTENASDGHTITDTTPNRAQLSFVRLNASGSDLEAVPAADIQGQTIHYSAVQRKAFDDLTEEDFLRGAQVDFPAAATVTRQVSYDNQGTTPVDLTTAATLDLEGAGLEWKIRDDLEADLFGVVEGSAGGTSQVNIYAGVDEFDVDAAVNDFANGATINSGGTRPIEVGVSDGLLRSTAGDLEVRGTGELILNDGNMIAEGTWTGPGVKVSDTTAEVSAYETEFGGEVSLMNAIVQAAQAGNGLSIGTRVFANVTADAAADADVGGSGGGTNLDAQLPDLSTGTFVDNHKLFLNGALNRPGADATANNDYYPGTSLALGQIKFEKKIKTGDVIYVETLV